MPALTYQITGFVNGDSTSDITGSPTLSTTATSDSTVGTYPITVDVSGLSAANYTFVPQDGTLTIIRATPTIDWPTPAAIVYGTKLSATQLDATASVPATPTYNDPLGTVLNAGSNQTLEVTFTPNDTIDYTSATKSVLITVNPAVLTVTAVNTSMTYGAALPNFSDTITGFVNGDNDSVISGEATFSTLATSASPPNTYRDQRRRVGPVGGELYLPRRVGHLDRSSRPC